MKKKQLKAHIKELEEKIEAIECIVREPIEKFDKLKGLVIELRLSGSIEAVDLHNLYGKLLEGKVNELNNYNADFYITRIEPD